MRVSLCVCVCAIFLACAQKAIVAGKSCLGPLGAVGSIATVFRSLVGGYASPTPITAWALLGNREDSQSTAKLVSLGVSHILNATTQLPNADPTNFIYLQLPLVDSEEADLTPHFRPAFAFFDACRNAGSRCLVHCVAGA